MRLVWIIERVWMITTNKKFNCDSLNNYTITLDKSYIISYITSNLMSIFILVIEISNRNCSTTFKRHTSHPLIVYYLCCMWVKVAASRNNICVVQCFGYVETCCYHAQIVCIPYHLLPIPMPSHYPRQQCPFQCQCQCLYQC